jgi:hypothetical protein
VSRTFETLELYARDLNRRMGGRINVRKGGSDEVVEKLLDEANEKLKGFGIEGFEDNDGYFVDYVNMGDTYDDTIYFDSLDGKFYAGSWGDLVESDEERFGEPELSRPRTEDEDIEGME